MNMRLANTMWLHADGRRGRQDVRKQMFRSSEGNGRP